MRILVTGGTGVIGIGLVPELLRRNHQVVLLSRHAEEDRGKYPDGVEAFTGDVTDTHLLRGAAEGCDAIVHIAGIAEESLPDGTFENVNVAGTANILEEAERAGARRFVFISSLGADRGQSRYHKSKFAAETLVHESSLDWVILRPGNVYGPGDEVISMLLKLVRHLPVVPLVGMGEQRFQPIWFEDLGKAIAEVLEKKGAGILELAGEEVTTTTEIIEKLGQITDRAPMRLPVPTPVITVAARLAERFQSVDKVLEHFGLALPITTTKLQMLLDENFIRPPGENALTAILGLAPTSLDAGLSRLADELPELLPDEGVGAMERKQFEVEIEGSRYGATELMGAVRENISGIMPIEFRAEPGVPDHVEANSTLTAEIPGRGHIQVRPVDTSDTEFTFMTVEGHPLAGTVAFRAEDRPGGRVRFAIEVNARAANVLDWIALRTVGRPMQNANWREVAKRVVELSGGSADGIKEHREWLSEQEADEQTERMRRMAELRSREQMAAKSS